MKRYVIMSRMLSHAYNIQRRQSITYLKDVFLWFLFDIGIFKFSIQNVLQTYFHGIFHKKKNKKNSFSLKCH